MDTYVRATAKKSRKTKELIPALEPGEIAVIDHEDLDEVAAIGLVAAKVRAVINVKASLSGKYPAPGASILLDAGILLVDCVGEEFFNRLTELGLAQTADTFSLVVDGKNIRMGDDLIGQGRVLTREVIDELTQKARENLKYELDDFVLNTLEYAHKERDLITGGVRFPDIKTVFEERPTVVVVRGPGYMDDLRAISSYVDEVGPLLVGVDGGADAIIEYGWNPDVIIGDMDSVSDQALQSGAELIVHAYRDGRAPGLSRIEDLGLQGFTVAAPGTSEDVALLMLYELGASVIVAVGTHSNIVDFFEKGRSGMASTFLVRLKVGSILVDARGLNQIYRGAPKGRYPYLIMTAALLPTVLITLLSKPLFHWFRLASLHFRLWAGL